MFKKIKKGVDKIIGKMADAVTYLTNPKSRITFGVIGGLFCIGCLATGIMEVKGVY